MVSENKVRTLRPHGSAILGDAIDAYMGRLGRVRKPGWDACVPPVPVKVFRWVGGF